MNLSEGHHIIVGLRMIAIEEYPNNPQLQAKVIIKGEEKWVSVPTLLLSEDEFKKETDGN